jgi:hypothetical protein
MEKHPDSPAVETATSAASIKADLNPLPAPDKALAKQTGSPPDNNADVPDDGAPPPGGYDPADYRWVPVRRRPRLDGWTEEKQRRFIEVLADTGLVSAAAKAVGMSRESAYRLRRSPHGAAFARAWDAARQCAGTFIEDVAFERAIEGVEHKVYDENGNVVCTRRAYNDRLLMFLLRNLKPERYDHHARIDDRPDARDARARPPELEASLAAMEPLLPAPPEQLLGPDELAHELDLADAADGTLPHFLNEQRPPKSAARIAAEARAAQDAREAAAYAKFQRRGSELSHQEWIDMCRHLDPGGMSERGRKRFR